MATTLPFFVLPVLCTSISILAAVFIISASSSTPVQPGVYILGVGIQSTLFFGVLYPSCLLIQHAFQ